jgi:hypothetical protein
MEAADGHCPECFERSGKRYDDFDEIDPPEGKQTAYRCEQCGVIVKCP